MQDLVVVSYCDIDMIEFDEKREATEVAGFADGVPMVVDLCVRHQAEIPLSDLEECLRKYGVPMSDRRSVDFSGRRRPRKTKGKGEPEVQGSRPGEESSQVVCEYPDCGRAYKNKESMRSHFGQAHGVTYTSWRAQQAGVEPTLKCDYKDCSEMFYVPQQRTAHMQQAHGWKKGDT